jgi:hypothetical protein
MTEELSYIKKNCHSGRGRGIAIDKALVVKIKKKCLSCDSLDRDMICRNLL